MSFPIWSPRSLCDLLINEKVASGEKFYEIVEKLITDERMRPAWETLERNAKKLNIKGFDEDGYAGEFIYVGVFPPSQGPSPWEYIPKAKLKSKFQSIRKKIKDITTFIKDTSIDRPLLEFISEQDFKLTSNANNQISTSKFLNAYSNYLLEKLNEYTELSLVQRRDPEYIKRTFFIRSLSKYLKRRYKKRLNEVVAITAQVILNDEKIDIDTVKGSLKNLKKA